MVDNLEDLGGLADRWTQSFFDHAFVAARLSKDPAGGVGAVIVGPGARIVSSGFNGLPSGINHNHILTSDRLTKLACTIHAEENALAFAWQDVMGMELYSTRQPCARCAAMIVQRNISCVHYIVGQGSINPDWAHSFKLADEMFNLAGVRSLQYVRQINECDEFVYYEWLKPIL